MINLVRACPYCSNVDMDKLEEVVGKEKVQRGCIGQCRAYKKEAVVKVDGLLTIKQSQEELFEELSK
ncbi:DUF1450 domain-containing protein [Romboutsia ilealis]|uniref:DUF1450 domain-containing protein n=1 Tax=Romboutsia faecis TaxID=2764597 RepID=A0ABR7JNY0_9FIRM|nr:DUF1450 domain-containing protein [Romboutsia faecis]MBC5996603.1 DUF1450 domain-containing protein [Romboutsia faecis]MRN24128.1 DUF1450 domain-containing protein [Romboutsia ilealis]